MTTLAIVVSLVGQAWAVNANGERRVLEVGDELAIDETLTMAEGARIDLDFGDNQQLTFLGEQQVTAEERGALIGQAEGLAPFESSEQPASPSPAVSDQGASTEGHGFVQLVRIGEIIEADGYTPVTVARIQEVLRPFGLSLPQRDFVRGSERDGTRYDERSYPESGSKLAKLSISIDAITGDDIVDATEAGQPVTLTGKVGGGVSPGDTVTVTVNGQLYNTTVNADGRTWQVDVPGSELAKDSKVQASVNSVEPNGTPVSANTERPYVADDKTPRATVELEPGSGPNGEYNEGDTNDGKVTGTVTFDPNTTEPGDTVKITDKDGNVIIERPITQGDIDNGIQVDVPVTDGQTNVELNVEVTDPVGNTSTGLDDKPVDNLTPGVVVKLEPGSGPNGDYNSGDLSDGKVSGTITFDPNTTVPGDRITATDKDGNPVFDANGDPVTDYELTQNDIDNGIVVDVPVAPGQTYVELNVDVTDPAGNTSTGFDNNPKDDITPRADVVLEPGSGPNGEYNDDDTKDGKVTGTVTFDPATTVPGDTVKITDKDGNVIIERPVTQDDIDNGITVNIPVVDGQTNVELNVKVTDPAGNTSSSTDSNTIDSVIPTVGVTLDGAGPDGVYNESEITNGEVPATITLDSTVEEGDVIEYTDGNGAPIAGLPPHTVSATDITNGSISVQVPVVPGQTNVELNATVTDPAGNTSSASDNKPVDNLPPETVTPIIDQTSDDADVVSLDISGNFNDLVSGSDITYSASGLPDGLSIDPDTGIISGTIDKSASQFGGNGEHTVTVTVTDEAGNSDDVNFNWGVNNPAPVAVDDTAIATEDQTLTVSAADGVLANDYDPDGDTPLVVTDYTINGQSYNAGDTATVTGVGQITLNADGSYEFVPEADYNGAVPPISYTVEDADGGTGTGELVISMDPVLDITLSAPAQVDEGDKITLTASVESPVQGSPLYVVLDNGQTITIPVGATSGTLDVDSRPDDEYVQGQTNQTFEVVSASGGTETINSSSFGATTTVGIVDVGSTVTARLSVDKTSTEEGAADLVYTVTLEDANGNAIAANNDVTVVTTQGSITITAGNSTGTLGVAVQGDDVYIDGETVSNEITSVSEANAGSAGSFENLDFDGAPVQTVVKDTIDPVYAIIEVDNGAVLEGGALTYTVKLVDANGDPAPAVAGKDVTVNLGWSGAAANTADVDALPASVTISGGSATTSFVVNTNSDAVAELSESITVTIDSVVDNAGTDPGFENLQVGSSGNSATAQVIDAPSIKVLDDNGAAAGQLTVNEQGLDTNDGSNTVSGVLRITAPSGLQSIEIGGQTFSLAQIENLASSNQTITVAGHGEITLKASSVVETANGQNAVWEVDFDYELTDAQTHTAQGADNALKDIPLGVSAADPQDANNSVTGSGNLGVLVTDDTPDVDLTGAKLDEAQVEEGQIGTPGGAEATVDFSGAFDVNHGADGDNGIVYELVIDSTASGLVDTASGDAVELFDNNGMVEGRNSNGDVVFTITVDGTTGEVTLVQNRALAHQDPLTPNDTVKITNGAISLKATATDGDNDTDTAKVNIGDRFVFRDDGPTAVADSANATEGGSTNGNVLGNDEPGSDGWANNGNAVVGVISGGGSAVENANVGQPVSGLYGTLTLNADGSYDYQANPDAVTADAQDVFTYTVKDGDGDLAEITLTINVADVSLPPVNTTDSVDESGLAGGSTAGDGSQIATGQVALPAGVEAIPQANIPTEHGEFSIDKDGNYTYTLTGSTDGDAVTDSFEYTTQDADGNTVTNTVTINIADDQPIAAADTGTVNEGATLTVGAGSGVLANDQSGADGWDTNGAVVGVTAGNTATNSTGGVGGRIDGDYGHLTLNADGSYTYVSTADAITADAQDVFTYTVRDADGDLAHTTLTIDVANESVPVTSISETVNESGLAGGSTEGDSSHISSGSVTLPAGVEVIPQNNINTAHGVFSIDANGNYSYTLTGNTNGDNVTDSFTYTTKDALGNTVINNATMTIVDDEPTALNDTNSITEDDAFIVGNVIAGDTDGGVADTLGADGATVTAITNNSSTSTTDANGNLVIQGEYGKLTISADGSYQYELDNSNPAVNALKDGVDLTENFTYTLTDGDGDADTAQLDITINGRTDGAPSITPVDDNGKDNSSNINTIGHVTVKESGLAGGSTAGSGHIETGSVDIAAGDGLAGINVAGTAITLAQLQAIDSGDSSTHITITGTVGELTLTGFDSTTNVGGVPTLGKLHFSYELTAAQNTPADSNDPTAGLNSTDDFALTVTDAGGADSSGTLVVNIIDDVPVAADDANSIVEDAAAPVTGNVIGNDTVGADGAGVTAISSVNVAGNTATNTGGVLEIDGAFGTLTINPDGSYSYALDNSNLTVQGLTDTESLTETFTYTLTDGDGDTASANLDLTINGTDDAVTVTVPVDDAATTPDGNTADHVVFESALATGSAPGAADTQVVSSFTVAALDGLAAGNGVSLAYTNVNGQARTLELSKAQVEALGTQSQTIDTQYGEIVLNGYSQAADGTITINYSYTLERAPQVTGNDTNDNIVITATDRDGDTDSQTLGIKVVDDAPTAVADVNDITEDAISVTGNVVANDTLGADGADVSAISSANVPGNTATDTAGVLEIDGAFGTLTINPDGSYTYALDNTNLTVQGLSNAETLTETFSYTLTDGDSDSDTADLVITINGTNDGVSLDIPVDNSAITPDGNTSDQVVFESGLANGSNPNPADTRVVSSFTVKALDGVDATEAVTMSYTDASGNPANLVLSQSELENLGTANQTLTTEYGELLLNGYTQAADGTIAVNYEYTLNNAPDVDATDNNDAFGIAVKDKDGDTDSQNLTIKIVDDAPSIENTGAVLPEVQVSESALGTAVSGDFSGTFSETFGADGGTVAYQLVVDNAASGLIDTASGEPINLVNNNGVIEGRTATGNDLAFTVVVDANGNVTLEQIRALQHSDINTPSDVLRIANGSLSLQATATDGDGDTDSASVAIGDRLAFQDDGPVASDDTATIDEDGTTPATGSVVSNDTLGGDGASVTGVTSTNVPGNTATDNSGVLTLEGQYGTLTINPDGTYSYALDNDNAAVNALKDGESLPESFNYTLTDGDGDTSTANLTITINGNTDGAPAITAEDSNGLDDASDITTLGDITVQESGLTDSSGTHTGTGTINISAADGLASIRVGGKTIGLSDLQGLNTGTPGSYIIINTDEGQITLTNFNATSDVGGVPTAGELEYRYELTDVQNTPADPNDADVGRNSSDTIALEVTGAGGDTSQSDLTVNIIDDTPQANADTGTVTEGATLTVSSNDGVLNNDAPGADGWDATGGVVGVVAGGGSGTTDDAATVGQAINGTYGVLTLNADGSYSYVSTANAVTADAQDVFTYTVKDGDGDLVETTLTINVNDVTGTPKTTTATVNEAGLAAGTDAGSDSHKITGGQLALDSGWNVNGAQSGTAANGIWSIAADGTFSYELTGATAEGMDDTDSFTYEVVDQYGNTASNTVNISIADDTPEVVITGTAPGSLTVDESGFSGGSVSATNATFVNGVFDFNHGADGAANSGAVVYSLETTPGNPASGVTDTATGTAIYLFKDGDDVVGRVGNTATGDIAFRIEIDPVSGAATLTQYSALDHPDSSNPNDTLSLTNSSVKLNATVKDGDGDTASVSEDIGGQFIFKDDGPSITANPTAGSVDEAYLLRGSEGEDITRTQVSHSLNVDFGTDGAGKVQFTEGVVDTTTAGLVSMGLESGGEALVYSVSADGYTLIAFKPSESVSDPVFTAEITDPTGTPGYKFVLNKAIDHTNKFGDSVSGLDLKFEGLQVTDGDGDTVNVDFTVTVMDDAPDPAQPQTEVVDEDSSAIFQTNADANQSNTSIGDGSGDTVAPSHGTVTVNSDGTITYVPDANYSGDDTFTYTTKTDNEEKTFTVEVTVNPVADAPKMDGAGGASTGGNVTLSDLATEEDVAVALSLQAPIITDDGTGAGNNAEAERLGEITLTLSGGDHVENVKLTAPIDGSSAAVDVDVPANGTVEIWLTDINHPADLVKPAGAIEMTTAQYEGLQLLPAAHRSENIDISIKASSYEVDGAGNIAVVGGTRVAAAESEASLKVYVQAVTDDVELVFDTSQTSGINNVVNVSYASNTKASVTINEDTPFKLNDILTASFEDLDGSEVRSITIENTTGQTIMVDGTALAAGATRDIAAKAGSAGQTGGVDSFPDITLGGNRDFSGDLTGIKVTINAQDRDDDGFNTSNDGTTVDGAGEANTANNSIELDLYVNPVAGDVSADGPAISTEEDTAVAFMKNIAVSDNAVGGSNEVITKVAFELPAGWQLTGQPTAGSVGDAAWTVSGDGSNANPYTIEFSAGSEANRELALKEFEVTPAAHSSKDQDISVTVTTVDTNTVNSSTVASDPVDTVVSIPVGVTPVAEVVGSDTDGNLSDDITMTAGYSYTTPGEEDTWFKLGEEGGFNLEDGWNNEDSTTELTYARLTPELIAGDGSIADATGSAFKYFDGSQWVEEVYGGDAIDVPVAYLNTLEFKAANNFSGAFEIKVSAYTRDYDEDDIIALGKTSIDQLSQSEIDGLSYVEAVSGSAVLENVLIKPVADTATTTVTANVKGNEDEQMPLSIRPKSSDPSETFNVTVSSIPEGATITYDGQVITESTTGLPGIEVTPPAAPGEKWSIKFTDFDPVKGNSMSLTAPVDSNVPFTLDVSTVSVDKLVVPGDLNSPYISESTPQNLQIRVSPKGVADEADIEIVDVASQSFTEESVELNGGIKLTDLISKAELKDDDGSETLTFKIDGLPDGFGLDIGTVTVDGTWSLTKAQLSAATLITPNNFSGEIDFNLTSVTTENDGDSLSETQKVNIQVTPTPEASINLADTVKEDTSGNLSFAIAHQNGDTDERLDEVWIKASDADSLAKMSLTFGQDGVSLAIAAADVNESDISLDDGWYKLSGTAIENIYAQGNLNLADSESFDVHYVITDPAQYPLGAPNPALEVSQGFDGRYTVTVTPETDTPELAITSNSTITLTDAGVVDVDLSISNQGGDYDGSEALTRIFLEGVPDGVTVQNAEYLGGGAWMLTPGTAFNGVLSPTVTLDVGNTASGLTGIAGNGLISVTVVTEDSGNGDKLESSKDISLSTTFGSNPGDEPADILAWAQDTIFEPTEDTAFALSDAINGEIANGVLANNFTVTLKGLPVGATVTGMVETIIHGETVWTASGAGGNAELQTLLDGITVKPPENWNSNKGDFTYDANLTTYVPGGVRLEQVANVNQQVTPVTDAAVINVTANGDEGTTVDISIDISNDADDPNWTLVDGKLYVSLNEPGDMAGGQLQDAFGAPIGKTAVAGIPGLTDGEYYVIEVPNNMSTVSLKYQPTDNVISGSVGITASVVGEEANAGSRITNTQNGVITVKPVNSGYDFSVAGASGSENPFAQAQPDGGNLVEVSITDNGLVDNDGSEEIGSVLLKDLPNGFLVYTGSDAASATLADNIGGDGSSNTWLLGDGAVPQYIGILPPANWSGTVTDLAIVVNSKETALDSMLGTERNFSLSVEAVANDVTINPTASFGKEGEIITLNLNAEMEDLQEVILNAAPANPGVGDPADSSVETVTLQLKGLGEHASFYIDNDLISDGSLPGHSVSYDGATGVYTIGGLSQDDLGKLGFIQADNAITDIEVRAQTVESANGDTSDWTHPENAPWQSVDANISKQFATNGADSLLWTGNAINGRGGDDTIQIRFGEDLETSDLTANLKNIETLDLSIGGSNAIGDTGAGLSIQDVLDITDSRNELKIDGDSDDSVFLKNNEWINTGSDGNGYTVYTDTTSGASLSISEQITSITMVD
ncbi:VCBS domain-containing protein [Marinobacter sp. 1-3A]|uniref:DUF5801 repeats-in-toxin domain-containing protein n=1 Tax=Marinobacter sp. 1-3A TaxID=2582920 RepID=UPI0019045616|nr:DUF5801 repeats-in-toxin domain-containing protein [Marinobacter sp. 1-3A]MBK1872024.1 VCBS domain-containing protein [Marinobacter sp. 1-3A]